MTRTRKSGESDPSGSQLTGPKSARPNGSVVACIVEQAATGTVQAAKAGITKDRCMEETEVC
ncbi:MAG: hypothetical protein QOK29_781 [Rhodospirillaceae bacterium]|jgi:hypothetical protein|nr:hypothetical protein [Rhodospirillaceae bacterium]